MRRAGGVDPGARKRSSRQTHPRAPHHPKTAGTPRPSPPVPPERGGCRTPPARARHVIFEDEDWAFLEKQQRCQYLKKKLTHIKARIQEYDHDGAVYF